MGIVKVKPTDVELSSECVNINYGLQKYLNCLKVRICQLFKIQEKQFVEDVNYLRKWLLEQPHLPKIELNDNFIGNFLIRHKFSIEKTKKALDMFFIVRKTFPEVYEKKDCRIISKEDYYDDNYSIILPEYAENLKHVLYFGISKENTFNSRLLAQRTLNMMEFELQNNFCVEEIVVVDVKNYALNDVLKLSPSFLIKFINTVKSIFKLRLQAVYLINNKPYTKPLITFLKTLVKDKLFQRLHIDVGYDCLHEILPKNMIPKDYGGDGPSLEELSKSCDLTMKSLQAIRFFDAIANIEVNEELRPEELRSNAEEIFGMYGSFKQLNLD